MADSEALARARAYSCPGAVVGLLVEPRYSGLTRPERQSQRNRFPASLHPGLAGNRAPRYGFVRHECPGYPGGTTRTGSGRHSLPASVSATGLDFLGAAGLSVVQVGASFVVGF